MAKNLYQAIPSLEKMLQREDIRALVERHGHQTVRNQLRLSSQAMRNDIAASNIVANPDDIPQLWAEQTASAIAKRHQSTHRAVLNLTGTVLHTNLGRAVLPEQAVAALTHAAANPTTVEFDLDSGSRGDRDSHVEALLRELTGAQAATVVNNNAAAVLLTLNSIASGREVIVSRGELVEIGGAFRMPQIMSSAGCVLAEVGTTNRTHLADFSERINGQTAALMTVHPSNYQIQGFTHKVEQADLAELAHQHGLPLIDDIGSGSLIDMRKFGLPHETTVAQALEAGADVVTFSGDKLLGGPQCGMIVGKKELINQIKKNPMKRALRIDKLTLAALEAVLRLYQDPDSLDQQLPALRQLTRAKEDIAATASQVLDGFQQTLAAHAEFEVVDCMSQIGSGALPVDLLPSAAIAINPAGAGDKRGTELTRWSAAMRQLPRPVIGRISNDRLILDLRTLERTHELLEQLPRLQQLLAAR